MAAAEEEDAKEAEDPGRGGRRRAEMGATRNRSGSTRGTLSSASEAEEDPGGGGRGEVAGRPRPAQADPFLPFYYEGLVGSLSFARGVYYRLLATRYTIL